MPAVTAQLPSKRVVTLTPREGLAPRARKRGKPLFSEALDLAREGDLAVTEGGTKVELAGLALQDFHAVRALATRLGWLAEEPIEITCKNCGEAMTLSPCAGISLGPFVDKELSDPELDRTLDISVPHPIPDVKLSGRRVVREISLAPRTAAEAAALHRALARRDFVVTADVAQAMGVVALGDEKHPEHVAHALRECSNEAWTTITDLFLAAHYPPRLFSIAKCGACGARNDVDAPFEREFEAPERPALLSPLSAGSNAETFPAFDAFNEAARDLAAGLLGDHAASVSLIVDGGVPACDDGGEPLLGSYMPEYAGDPTQPSHPPEITVFFRTFRAMWDDDGPYDWRAELSETIEHELEHHVAYLSGDDPVDDEERAEIEREAARIIGKKAVVREAVGGAVSGLGHDVAGFLRRTWVIWLIVLLATLVVILTSR